MKLVLQHRPSSLCGQRWPKACVVQCEGPVHTSHNTAVNPQRPSWMRACCGEQENKACARPSFPPPPPITPQLKPCPHLHVKPTPSTTCPHLPTPAPQHPAHTCAGCRSMAADSVSSSCGSTAASCCGSASAYRTCDRGTRNSSTCRSPKPAVSAACSCAHAKP
eukprot:355525-Chlamydomonas_euryale.AAC.2